jgi:hypothetical protein
MLYNHGMTGCRTGWLFAVGALCFGLAAMPARAQGTGPTPDYVPPLPKQGYSYPDCYCTDTDGKRVEMGETACLRVGDKQILARCDMSVNSPTWRYETEGCPGV